DAPVPVIGDRPAALPRHFSIIDPISWSEFPYTASRTLIGLQWTYAFAEGWKVTQRLHYIRSDENQQGVYADGFDGVANYTGIRFTHTGPNWLRTELATNLDLSGEVTTGPLRHKLLVGADWSRFTDDTPGSTGDLPGAAALNVFAPVWPDYATQLRALSAVDASNVIWRDRSWDAGVYFQDEIEIGPRWLVLVSGRYDWAQDAYSDTYGTRSEACYPNCTGYPVTPYPTDRAFSPRAALLYRINPSTSLYFSYAKSFGSANGRDAGGLPLKPQIGEQYEVGLKAAMFGGRLTGTASIFNLTKSNIPEYDPINVFPHIVGEARSRGLELDLLGQLTPSLSVIASYTYDDAVITHDPYGGTQGKQLSGAAKSFGSVWLKYEPHARAAKGWSFGAGLYATGRRWGDDANTWVLPGYARVDLMAAYRFGVGAHHASIQVNVNNLFDTSYFDHGGYGMAAYGAPRTVMSALRVDF
ncbi:MAG: TonB-dependent receptor, partial [Proteobacteria bacterium]|nr:TonB-dependent receptor [Pseudomonadota bacterium]